MKNLTKREISLVIAIVMEYATIVLCAAISGSYWFLLWNCLDEMFFPSFYRSICGKTLHKFCAYCLFELRRSNVVTEDISKLFVKKNSQGKSWALEEFSLTYNWCSWAFIVEIGSAFSFIECVTLLAHQFKVYRPAHALIQL